MKVSPKSDKWATSWEKPVFGVCVQLRLKPTCSATETSNFQYQVMVFGIILSRQRPRKVLIRLRECAGKSAPLLFAYSKSRFSPDVTQMVLKLLSKIFFFLNEWWNPGHTENNTGYPFKLRLWGVSRAMRKCALCHMRTTKAQISLRIRAVWSAPLLFAT